MLVADRAVKPAETGAVNDNFPGLTNPNLSDDQMNGPATLQCPQCKLALDRALATTADVLVCPACTSRLSVVFFPAFDRPPDGPSTSSGSLALEGEAVCFFHTEKRAEVACERCGRFLCALCDLPIGGKHLCPSCFDTQKTPELTPRRMVWNQLAFSLGVLPLLLCFLYPFYVATAPAAIFIGLWKWNAEGSLVHGRRWWLSLAAVLGGVIQLGVLGGIGFGLYTAIRHG